MRTRIKSSIVGERLGRDGWTRPSITLPPGETQSIDIVTPDGILLTRLCLQSWVYPNHGLLIQPEVNRENQNGRNQVSHLVALGTGYKQGEIESTRLPDGVVAYSIIIED